MSVPRGEEGNIDRGTLKGNKTQCFPRDTQVFCYTSQLKNRKKKLQNMICFTPTVAVLAVRAAIKPSHPIETSSSGALRCYNSREGSC